MSVAPPPAPKASHPKDRPIGARIGTCRPLVAPSAPPGPPPPPKAKVLAAPMPFGHPLRKVVLKPRSPARQPSPPREKQMPVRGKKRLRTPPRPPSKRQVILLSAARKPCSRADKTFSVVHVKDQQWRTFLGCPGHVGHHDILQRRILQLHHADFVALLRSVMAEISAGARTILFECNHGKHRSVATASIIGSLLIAHCPQFDVVVRHLGSPQCQVPGCKSCVHTADQPDRRVQELAEDIWTEARV